MISLVFGEHAAVCRSCNSTRESTPDSTSNSALWLYLGDDYLAMRRLEARLGPSSRIKTAAMLEKYATQLRRPFVDWLGEMGKPYGDQLHWWLTPTSGRNVTASPLFLHLCYLHILDEVLANHTPTAPLIIATDDLFVFLAIRHNLSARGLSYQISLPSKLRIVAGFGKELLLWFGRWAKRLIQLVRSASAARSVLNNTPFELEPSLLNKPFESPVAILHTSVDNECMRPDGSFGDRYFPNLREWLENQGYTVLTVPWLCNVSRPLRDAYAFFSKSPQRFLHLERYFSIWDLPWAIISILKCGFALRGVTEFKSLKISPLIVRERLRNSSLAGALPFLLYIPAIKRWLNRGGRCDLFVDMFENNPGERPPIIAWRTHSPNTFIVGYQHAGGIPPVLMDYSLSAGEWERGIFPDRIVANSDFTRNFLIENHFPDGVTRLGPALRFRQLSERAAVAQAIIGSSVLVPLSLELASSTETVLLMLATADLWENYGLKILFKPHPMMFPSQIRDLQTLVPREFGCEWVTGPIHQLLDGVRFVITESSPLLDATAFGVPAICIARELQLTYNPLTPWQDQYRFSKTVVPEELRATVVSIMEMSTAQLQQLITPIRMDILRGLGGYDDAHFAAFLPQPDLSLRATNSVELPPLACES